MPATAGLVRHRAEAPTVPCPCGDSTRVLTAADGGPCSVHVTRIRNSKSHYHKETTEVYYILSGTGEIELDDDWYHIRPGSVIHIPAGVRHRLVADREVETLVVAAPPFRAEDEWFD